MPHTFIYLVKLQANYSILDYCEVFPTVYSKLLGDAGRRESNEEEEDQHQVSSVRHNTNANKLFLNF